MKNTTLLAICLSSLILLTACKEEVPEPENFKFPFKVGNQWTYKRIQELKNVIAMDGESSPHDTTIVTEVHILLNDYTEENTGLKCIQLASTVGNQTHYSYYLPPGEVLFCIMDATAGLDDSALFPQDLDKFFCNIVFLPKNLLKSASVLGENKNAVLKYPLEVGSKWNCDPLKNIKKEVTGLEKIMFYSKSYDCYKIDYTCLKDSTATTIDYISSIGLLKREAFIKQIEIDEKAYGDYYETWELMNYHLQ